MARLLPRFGTAQDSANKEPGSHGKGGGRIGHWRYCTAASAGVGKNLEMGGGGSLSLGGVSFASSSHSGGMLFLKPRAAPRHPIRLQPLEGHTS
jgi:hypothetical protein